MAGVSTNVNIPVPAARTLLTGARSYAVREGLQPLPTRRDLLEDVAPKLVEKGGGPGGLGGSGQVWELIYDDASSRLYLDTSGAVNLIKSWAEMRCRDVGRLTPSGLPALVVSGLSVRVRSGCRHACMHAATGYSDMRPIASGTSCYLSSHCVGPMGLAGV